MSKGYSVVTAIRFRFVSFTKQTLRVITRVMIRLRIHHVIPAARISSLPGPIRRRLMFLRAGLIHEELDPHAELHFHRLTSLRKG